MTTPLLKYAGGKTKLLPELIKRMPTSYGRYYEPFVGGGALFFALQPEQAVLGDANADLMATYQAVADDPDRVIAALAGLRAMHSKKTYLATREQWNERWWIDAELRAAAFIYLNRSCYNGLWRVNRAGRFNVPMGRYKDPLAGIAERIRGVSAALSHAALRTGDYRATFADAQPGDFVYLDSPYCGGTFTAYTNNGFTAVDQAELAYEARKLAERGVKVMLSNADTPRIQALYAGMRIDVVRCPRAINSNTARRGNVNEVIVTAGYTPAAMERAA